MLDAKLVEEVKLVFRAAGEDYMPDLCDAWIAGETDESDEREILMAWTGLQIGKKLARAVA